MEENQPTTKSANFGIKDFGSYIPILSAAIVSFSLLKLSLYYKAFNLPISNFISLGELGILISDDIFLFIFYVSVPIILIYAVVRGILPETPKDIIIHDPQPILFGQRELLFLKKTQKSRKKMNLFIISMVAVFYGIFLFMTIKDGITTTSLTAIIGSAFFGTIFSVSSNTEGMMNNKLFFSVLTLLITVSVVTYTTESETFEVRFEGKYKGTTIYRKEAAPFISTDNDFYIGKTEKFLFIYHLAENHTTVITMEDVKQIDLKIHE